MRHSCAFQEAEKQEHLKKKQEVKNKQTLKQGSSETTPIKKNKQPSQKKRKISSEPADQSETKHPRPNPESPAKSKFPRNPTADSGEVDKSKYPVTIFVSNLSYSATEDDLNNTFKQVGDIVDIRLVKSVNNKSRGFGYIEFHTREEALAALEMDRVPVLERPCYVSECKERGAGSKAEFKFSTRLEKHKLFVNNLPYSVSEAELREIFESVGKVKSVRMVTTKSGKFKGFAYVEYVSSDDASKAVMELDGKEVGDRVMSVAISNPPGKSGASSAIQHRDRALESEKGDSAFNRKKKMNFLVPRAVTQPKTDNKQTSGPSAASAVTDSSETSPDPKPDPSSKDNSDSEAPKQMLPNDFFSNLFNK